MKPIGLKYKNLEINPFTDRTMGELMIVHRCANCGHISSNRIAGDDNPYEILKLLIDPSQLNNKDMVLLTRDDKNEVAIILFGGSFINI